MCAKWGEGHMAGSNDCEMEQKERVIWKLQADNRVGKRRPLQILAGEDESPRSNFISYHTHFRCKMDPEKKIKFNPWAIEKNYIQEIGRKPVTIKSINETEVVFEISNEKESNILPALKSLFSAK